MPAHKDQVFEDWWPLFHSLVLVRAPVRAVARAMKRDAKRMLREQGLLATPQRFEWVRFGSVDELFVAS